MGIHDLCSGPFVRPAILRCHLHAWVCCGLLLIAASGSAQTVLPSANYINTIAGTGTAGYNGDNIAATSAEVNHPVGVAVDGAGNVYIADTFNYRIRKITVSTGLISTVAGNGTSGKSGDNGPATQAELDNPSAVALDAAGNIYIDDSNDLRIRVVNTGTATITIAGVAILPGDIATVAGNGSAGYNGDGIPATSAELNYPLGVAVDSAGNIYIADADNYRIRAVNAGTTAVKIAGVTIQPGHIATIAGTGTCCYSGDYGPATNAQLDQPWGVALDSAGNIYLSATGDTSRVREVTAGYGIITTVAGNGVRGFAGDGGVATSAELDHPQGLAIDSSGDIYASTSADGRIRQVHTSGVITTIAGDGTNGYSGDGGLATSAELNQTSDVAVDQNADVYIADYDNSRIRVVGTKPSFTPAAGSYTGTQSVTIGGVGSLAVIYYTTDGTTPTTSSNFYTGPVVVAANKTLKAVATYAVFPTSAVASSTYTISGGTAAATPTFSPVAGTYTGTQSVTIGDTTTGAMIYYTVNGTTPTTSSAQYFGPVPVSVGETLKAIAVADGGSVSAVGSSAYSIITPTPTFSPAAGSYTGSKIAYIDDKDSPSIIYYTSDGSTPTTSSPVYPGSIWVTASQTIKAIATTPGCTTSAVGSVAYTITSGTDVATPTFSPAAGTYAGTQSVTISDTTTGSKIFYTTNGTTPTTASTQYSTAIVVDATETIKALAVDAGDSNSLVASAQYTINAGTTTVATPTFSPAAGTYTGSQSVTISDTTSGKKIFYTTDGTTPTPNSKLYSSPIWVAASQTVKAIATVSGDSPSAVAGAAYTINSGLAAATPTFSPAAGIYPSGQTVTISDTTSGATIYYTTDGTTPSTASSKYTAPITVNATKQVGAIAIASGDSSSAVGSAVFTILLPAATPTFSPVAGSYDGTQTVTISDTTSGAKIYYSISGATPVEYSSPVSVSVSETLTAFAIASGGSQSVNASGTYIITTCTQ